MSSMKRLFEDITEDLSDIDLFDFLVDHGWSEDEAKKIIRTRRNN